VRGVFRLCIQTGSQHDLEIPNRKHSPNHRKEDTLKPINSINAILDALASQRRQGENSLIVTINPGLIQDAMQALRDHRKLFAPVIPGQTDTKPVYAAYEEMRRQADTAQHTILLFVECKTIEEFREALRPLPMRHSSEWRAFDKGL
jgi:hypothetical protein